MLFVLSFPLRCSNLKFKLCSFVWAFDPEVGADDYREYMYRWYNYNLYY